MWRLSVLRAKGHSGYTAFTLPRFNVGRFCLSKVGVFCGVSFCNGTFIFVGAGFDAGFNAGFAMQRNKFIYAQSKGTIVVKSDYDKGGTWSGATEALRNGYCPVFCRNNQKSLGNKKLIELGAIAIDENWDGKLDVPVTKKKDPKEDQLSLFG